MTDEEQDIAQEIDKTVVDSAMVTNAIGDIVFGEIYTAKKFKYGKYDFAYDRYTDDTQNGSASGGVRLSIITAASDRCKASDQRLIMDSQTNNEAAIVLSNDTPYFDELWQAMKILKYAKQQNLSQRPESVRDIIARYRRQARELEKRAKSYIEKAITDAKTIVNGEVMDIKASNAKDKLDIAMTALVESVYYKLNMVNKFVESDADILAILNGADNETLSFTGTGANNEEALNRDKSMA